MKLSIATDYASDHGDVEPYLAGIADAGFGCVQWIQRWSGDYFYTRPEVEHAGRLLKKYGLELRDLHASIGVEQSWCSEREVERLAGVELVRNRIDMCRTLGGEVIVMHVPRMLPENEIKWNSLRKSLKELKSHCAKKKLRIAIENLPHDDFNGIAALMDEYPASYLGICYDSGHGNMGGEGPGHIAKFADRILSLHLHDNNGFDDQHKPLFSGTLDWSRLAEIIRGSSYDGPLTLELSMRNSGISDERVFLGQAFEDAKKFNRMVGN